jgi:hypothetical protein
MNSSNHDSRTATRTRVQFSLLSLMVLFVVAAVLSALATIPQEVANPLLLLALMLLLPHLVMGAISSRGGWRGFCVGALVPLGGWTMLSLTGLHAFILFGGQRDPSYLEAVRRVVLEGVHFRTHSFVMLGLLSPA